MPRNVEPMIRAKDLIPLRGFSSDMAETNRLLEKFRTKWKDACSVYLTYSELDEVMKWKLRGQYGRTVRYRQGLTDETVRTVTKAAFGIRLQEKSLELRMRIGVLTVLPGVGVPVASAILALVDPETYGVLDFRAWRQVFPNKQVDYSASGYLRYMQKIWPLVDELQWTAQEVDLAIWQYDLEHPPTTA